MKVIVILIVVGEFRTMHTGLVKILEDLEIRGQADNIQSVALLRLVRMLRKVLKT